MIKKIKHLLFFVSVSVLASFSCKKPDIATPPELAQFMAKGTVSYPVQNNANSVFKFGIGLTAPAKTARNVTFSISSPTGAVEGQQYTIASKSITIPAGQVIDSVSLKGIFNGFPSGRRDTLVFTITGGDVPALIGSDILKVVLQQFCPLDMNIFDGDFEVLEDEWADYAPGTIVQLTKIGTNQFSFEYNESGAQPIIVTVNTTTNVTSVAKQVYTSANGYGLGYGPISVESVPSVDNIVVPCERTFSVRLKHTVAAGSFGDNTIKMRKL